MENRFNSLCVYIYMCVQIETEKTLCVNEWWVGLGFTF